jgi:hypothetical protein
MLDPTPPTRQAITDAMIATWTERVRDQVEASGEAHIAALLDAAVRAGLRFPDEQLKYSAVDVHLIGADTSGMYALIPDAPRPWSSPPVTHIPGDPCEEWTAAELELIQHGVDLGRVPVIHPTSWRSDGPALVTHFLAVYDSRGATVKQEWPEAKPISFRLADQVGQPAHHGAAAPPLGNRNIDIMRHALRHLRALTDPGPELCPECLRRGILALWRRLLGLWCGGHVIGDFYDVEIAEALPAVYVPHLKRLRAATAWMFGPISESA